VVPIIAQRAIVLGEDRRVMADGPADEILRDEALLIRANLIHEHLHRHATVEHAHPHMDGHHSEPDHTR
jgi:cobalt/nickel transport system ATP-binding protein